MVGLAIVAGIIAYLSVITFTLRACFVDCPDAESAILASVFWPVGVPIWLAWKLAEKIRGD